MIFFDLLIKHNKQFLVISSVNAPLYKSIRPLVLQRRIWLGKSFKSCKFIRPDGSTQSLGSWCWLQNLKEHCIPPLILDPNPIPLNLWKSYTDGVAEYEVGSRKNMLKFPWAPGIVAGVPVSFLGYWCPKQFQVTGYHNGPRVENESKNRYRRLFVKLRDKSQSFP